MSIRPHPLGRATAAGLLAAIAATTVIAGTPQAADPLARPPGTDFRVVVWNVHEFAGWREDRKPVFTRLFEAIDPDLLMLQEVSARAEKVTTRLPAPAAGAPSWHVEKRGGELVVATRSGAELTLAFRRPLLPPATGFYESLGELLFGQGSVAAVGIQVTDGPRRMLAVPVHYPNDEPGRLASAPALRDAVNQALAETQAAAAIVAGDFNLYFERGQNLVGRRDALEIVQRGVNVGGVPLAVLEPFHLDGRDQATWRGAAGAKFPPGRLDWMLYSDKSLEVLHAFVFEAADLSPEWLKAHGLQPDDSDPSRSSDHLPIVADFRWRR